MLSEKDKNILQENITKLSKMKALYEKQKEELLEGKLHKVDEQLTEDEKASVKEFEDAQLELCDYVIKTTTGLIGFSQGMLDYDGNLPADFDKMTYLSKKQK